MRKSHAIGWLLSDEDRTRLLSRVPARYARTIAHHVTLKTHAASTERAPQVRQARVVGTADDGVGVQALVVEIDGGTGRPDGGTYHITWSLEPSRRAVESNDVIAAHGWTAIDPVPISLTPARF